MYPPVPAVFALAQIVFAREPRVHAATRPSLRPHLCRGQAVKQSSGARRRESARACRYAHVVICADKGPWQPADVEVRKCGQPGLFQMPNRRVRATAGPAQS